MQNYNHKQIEAKWQKYWQENKIFQPDFNKLKKPFYNLMMFPYPSAEGLHVGNMYAFTGSDIYGRFMKLNGYDLFEPIGLDGFGINSENYAIKQKIHPAKMAEITKKNFYRQLKATGNAYAWDNTLETYDPEYYKWTQWLFLQLYKKGLVERKEAPVNWCPSCKTVLSDEQAEGGKCERCKSEVIKKNLNQWFFKITDYAEKLYQGLDKIDWSEKVKIAQRNWIGRSEGTQVKFKLKANSEKIIANIEVFTTRIDTIFGCTYLVISPEHKIILKLKNQILNLKEIEKYIIKARNKSDLERTDLAKEKTGVELKGVYAINPANNNKIPVFVADYVLPNYGTGAIMAVPAHDERDFDFAKKYKLPITKVIKANSKTQNNNKNNLFTDLGILINSDKFSGMDSKNAIIEITKFVKGKKTIQYKLRDWLISRQRYWGPPIPMINCPKCGWVTVPEEQLPIKLPETDNWHPKGDGTSPLANIKEFIDTKCPKCNAPAKRETDVSDTFLDSAWYFLRYPCAKDKKQPFDKKVINKWLPVDMYIGGAEHSVLHLLYVRFITIVLNETKLINFSDPFKKFRAHGLIIKDGDKMSKSKGNVINPDEYIEKYGADVLRIYLMFLGPFTDGGDFRDGGIKGIERFLGRINDLVLQSIKDKKIGKNLNSKLINVSIQKISDDIKKLKFNTVISQLMIQFNGVNGKPDWRPKLNNDGKWEDIGCGKTVDKQTLESFIKLLSPFAPHLAEELWKKLGNKQSIFMQKWPKATGKIIDEICQIPVIVNGKKRTILNIENIKSIKEKDIINLAVNDENIKKYLINKKIKKTIYISGKILSIVI